MIWNHLFAITIALLIDRFIGDPPTWPHPVKWFGKYISFVDKRWNSRDTTTLLRLRGILMLACLVTIVLVVSYSLLFCLYFIHPITGIIGEAIFISTTIAQKSLRTAALDVYNPLLNGNLLEAREKLSYIVGRDTEHLNESEVVRGTVETVAENTSDGITAPLFWALVGGAPLALVYRAVNTCDSMVGYKNEQYLYFGWASARVDDLLNWIPSRLTALCMVFTMPTKFCQLQKVMTIVFRDAKKHPSPNSGWGEAAVAALLDSKLGGVNYYKGIVSNRAIMGSGQTLLVKEHINKTISIMHRTVLLFYFLLTGGTIAFVFTKAWIKSTLSLSFISTIIT